MALSAAVPGSVQSIERAAAILQIIAASRRPLGVTDIASAVGLAKTTTHSLLRTLLLVGFVEQDRVTACYSLGPGLLGLGRHLDLNELRARSSNWADALASRSGQAVRLATLVGDQVIVVHHVFRPDDSAQVLDIGTPLPAHTTALGKVLHAFAVRPPTARQGQRSAGDSPTTADDPEWRAELIRIRTRGWATDQGGHDAGLGGLSAPVRGATGLVVCALGVVGPPSVLFDARSQPRALLVSLVTDAAQGVSRELGYRG